MKKKNLKSTLNESIILKLFIVLLIAFCMNFVFYSNVQASELSYGITESYKRWSNLSEEEKEKYIQPLPFSVNYDSNSNLYKKSRLAMLQSLRTSYQSEYKITDLTMKDQQDTQECWAFSTTSVLESNIMKITNSTSPVFSPRHMDYATSKTFLDGINSYGFNRELGSGGNFFLAMAYCTNGRGPILESDMPFENNENKINLSTIEGKNVVRHIKNYKVFPNIHKEYTASGINYYNGYGSDVSLRLDYTESDVQNIRNMIKDHIIRYGAVTSYTYVGGTADVAKYFNMEKVRNGQTQYYAYNCDNPEAIVDHAITIVGWDDNFSADNFNDGHKPKHNGAYIVQNSYGSDIFNNGYMYISYDDVIIERAVMGIINSTDVQYDKTYQHDPLGYSTDYIPKNAMGETFSSAYGANIFSRDTSISKPEKLTEVSFYINSTTNIEIYVNGASGDLTQCRLAKSVGTLQPGYYTFELDTPVELTGDKFVVAIKYNADVARVPIECNYASNHITETSFWDTATSSRGESLISANGTTWTDLLDLNVLDSNICIKAFTNYEEEDPTVHVSSVTLNTTSNVMEKGDTFTLVANVMPENATNKNVTWTSNNTEVATVDQNGRVTAVDLGMAIITVTTQDGSKTASCQINVREAEPQVINVTGVEVSESTNTMNIGDIFALSVRVLPEDATNQTVTWTSDNTQVATVDQYGQITAVAPGTATITVTTQDGNKTATCQITVREEGAPDIRVTGIEIDTLTKTVNEEDEFIILAKVLPENATNKKVTWTSDNTQVATVEQNGRVTAVAPGTATITVTTQDGSKTASCNVTVTKKIDDVYVKITRITLNTTNKTLYVGDGFKLTATITPDNATNQDIVWESSDSSIATVNSNGNVKAISKGITTITAKNIENGISESCIITVLDEDEDKNTNDQKVDDDKKNDMTIQPVNKNDGTTAPGEIPQAGMSYVIIIMIVLVITIGIIIFIKLHQTNDVK